MRPTMTGLLLISGLTMSGIAPANEPSAAQPVAHQGTTHIAAGAVTVDLTTRPATSIENAADHATRCSGGWTDCSLVDALSIRIAGQEVAIPDRLTVLLSDIATARVTRIGPDRYRLTLAGGDAAAAYEARLYFDRHMVRRMELWSGEMHAIEQATDYHDIASEVPSN